MKAAVLVFLAAAGLAAPRTPELDALIDQARSSPPEFAADALIRIAGLSTLDKERRVELLSEAFQDASGAQRPYKRYAAIRDLNSAARYYDHVFAQDLDGLSLRLRAIEGLLPLDRAKARQLFEQIPPPAPPKLTCEDYLAYDLSRYYEVLGRVAAETFTAAEIKQGRQAQLAAHILASVDSSAQVAPAARMLASAPFSDDDFQMLATVFAGALRGIAGDDRSFSAAPAGPAIFALVQACERRKMVLLPVTEAYRTYLVNNLTGARCADDDRGASGTTFSLASGRPEGEPTDFAGYFNAKIVKPPLQPIDAQEATASKVEGEAKGLKSCDDAECKAIVRQYRGLVFGADGEAYSADRKRTPEWRSMLTDFLSALADWQQSSGLTDAEFYREKSAFYSDLFGVVTDTGSREKAAAAAIQFYTQSRFRAANRVEWFLPVNTLIARAGADPYTLGWLAEDLRNADDPLIRLYMAVEKAAPRPPESILPLL